LKAKSSQPADFAEVCKWCLCQILADYNKLGETVLNSSELIFRRELLTALDLCVQIPFQT